MGEDTQAEWYYVGHYGQLGPLTLEQMSDLVADGVIDHETFVWKSGMPDWSPAKAVQDLQSRLHPDGPPPGPYSPTPHPPEFRGANAAPMNHNPNQFGTAPNPHYRSMPHGAYGNYSLVPKSDKSRVAAGILNLLPGFGRFYLGYAAHGVMQLLTTVFCGVGLIWSWIDGLYILVGGVKYDGYGRAIDE